MNQSFLNKKAPQGQLTVDLGRCERYLCVMLRGLTILLLIGLPIAAWPAQSGRVSSERPAEYMIYQYPGVSLVVKIDAPEVPFTSKIFGPEETLIMSSGIPSARIGPLYQLVPPVDTPRQLMIKVSPDSDIERSTINMELIQLPASDRNSANLAQAYRLLSHGTEQIYSNDTTTWAMKAYTLRSAANAFAGFGWEEMRLLSEYYAAHLVLHKLNDELLSLEMSREIQRAARRAGIEWIELAALTLEGDALMSAAGKADGSVASARYEQLHSVLDQVVILSHRQGMNSEQARALYNDALVFLEQDQKEAAIRQLQRALDISLSVDNPELVNEIRATAASTYESLGSTTDAISMLQDIGTELEGDIGEEVTDNLYEKGRMLNASFRYEEAALELSRALELQKSEAAKSGSWGPVALALAWSWYSMGDSERAADLFLQAIPRTSQTRNPDALVQAYLALANIFRDQQSFARIKAYREKQGMLARSEDQRVEHAFESALDAWQSGGPRSRQAYDLLVLARRQALAAGLVPQAQQAAIYLCLLKIEQGGGDRCSRQEISGVQQSLEKSGSLKLAVEADFVVARIQSREGRKREATVSMEQLLDRIEAVRQEQPGVLGAWYWQSRTAIFEEYMGLVLEQSAPNSSESADGTRALLALNRIRKVESAEFSGAGSAGTGDSTSDSLTASSLQSVLNRLSPDESVLSYYLGEPGNFVLVGTRQNVSLIKLKGSSPSLSEGLLELREMIVNGSASATSQLDSFGRVLLGPLAGRLTDRIYLLPGGALSGFPFSALRLNGEFLAANHEVINLMNLSPDTRFQSSVPNDFGQKVFLAGNPQSGQALFSYDLQVSPEISMVTDRFVGPGLQIVQGVALKPDEFRDDRLTGAHLVHLAMPGTLDLPRPDRSKLLMSGSGGDSGAEFLFPGGLNGLELGASLVVFSHTAVSGVSPTNFDNRIGIVSDFLEMGAGTVLASLWVSGDREATDFVEEFYRRLEVGLDPAEALSQVWKEYLKQNDEMNLGLWAGFQLFIR